jgi:pyruvate/2-oxoglutarate dehydrogenase complex dihydrolipoamide dehydrogenase (E3) component
MDSGSITIRRIGGDIVCACTVKGPAAITRVSRTGGAFYVETFDLVVIGSGPAGEKGAAQAAYFGKRVALIERRAELRGTGINTGTVPSKMLRESALYFSGLRQRGLYGIDYSLREGLTVQELMDRRSCFGRTRESHRESHGAQDRADSRNGPV